MVASAVLAQSAHILLVTGPCVLCTGAVPQVRKAQRCLEAGAQMIMIESEGGQGVGRGAWAVGRRFSLVPPGSPTPCV